MPLGAYRQNMRYPEPRSQIFADHVLLQQVLSQTYGEVAVLTFYCSDGVRFYHPGFDDHLAIPTLVVWRHTV